LRVGRKKLEGKSEKAKVRGQKSEGKSWKEKVRRKKSEGKTRRYKLEVMSQKFCFLKFDF